MVVEYRKTYVWVLIRCVQQEILTIKLESG